MVVPSSSALANALDQRYAALASSCCSLSCGQALDLAAPAAGETLVDLGCGRGQDVIRAAGRVGSTGQAIGVDRNDTMLATAKQAVPPFLSNVRFLRSPLEQLDLPPGVADVVISNCTINHATDKQAVYAEIHRVLKPGGRFVVSDVVADQELPLAVRQDPAAWAACYGGAIPEQDNLQAMRAAGFPEVTVLSRSEPYEKGGVMVRSVTFRGVRP